jgi:hypothetical protein
MARTHSSFERCSGGRSGTLTRWESVLPRFDPKLAVMLSRVTLLVLLANPAGIELPEDWVDSLPPA